MKDYATRPRFKAMTATPKNPVGYPSHSSITRASVELVNVNPDQFLQLERMGKRRKRPITLAPIGILTR